MRAKIAAAGLTFAEAPAASVACAMPLEPPSPPAATPDRTFARVTGLVAGIGLAVILATHVVLDRAASRQALSAERAMVAASEVAAARAVVVALDRLAALPPGAEDRTARTRLAWDIERLVAQDARRLALTPGLDGAEGPLAAAAATARRFAEATPRPDALAALQAEFEGRLLPQLDLIAARSRTAADADRARSRGLLIASFARPARGRRARSSAAVVVPARRRIGTWVARATDEAREHRFRLLHDPLTGLPNAAYLQAHLERIAAANRARQHADRGAARRLRPLPRAARRARAPDHRRRAQDRGAPGEEGAPRPATSPPI